MNDSAIYCLGNDAVAEWLAAFFASVRRHEPERPLFLIPFDEQLERSKRLAEKHGADILAIPELEELDRLGSEMWPDDPLSARSMRKLAAFIGPAEQFMLFDSDIVLLQPLQEMFEGQVRHGCDFVFFDDDIEMVYRPGQLRSRLREQGRAWGFNAGAWGGRRNAIPIESLPDIVRRAREVRAEFIDILEQSFLNYCVDLLGLQVCAYRDLVPGIGGTYAGLRFVRREDGTLAISDARRFDSGWRPPFIHWSGHALNPFMPYRRVFLDYRLPDKTRFGRAAYEARALANLLVSRSELRRLGRSIRPRVQRYVRRHPALTAITKQSADEQPPPTITS